MTSPLLALFGRSLREDARLKITYVARVGLVLMILLFLLSISAASGWGNAPGLTFFSTVAYINLGFIILAGFSYFASAVAEEKEEMTLGLLRMTNLNALSILLGKSTSRLVGALLLLIAQFPFTLLAISLGGISVGQIVAAYCTLAAFIIFLSNLALLASVMCRTITRAAALTAAVLLFLFMVVPILHTVVMLPVQMGIVKRSGALLNGFDAMVNAISVLSPFTALEAILKTGFSGSAAGVQVWSNLALGAACFLLAWAVFETFCNEQHESAPTRGLVPRGKSRLRSLGAGRTWKRALAWKDFYFLAGGRIWIVLRLVLYAVPLVLIFAITRRFNTNGNLGIEFFGWASLWVGLLIGCVEMAFLASAVFRRERQWKTLSSLAMLPMPTRRWAYQKLLGCLPALIPAAFYSIAGFCCVFSSASRGSLAPSSNDLLFFSVFIAQGIFFLHLVTWLSLYLKRGALPVAIGLEFVAGLFLSIVIGAVFRDATTVVLLLLSLGGAVLLHYNIGYRLEDLASEE
jgi:hypothetical protein